VNHCWTGRAVEDDQFEEVASTVRSEHEEAKRVVADFFADKQMAERVIDVESVDVVALCRRQDLHTTIS
jgi:hypothetical protein